MRAMSLSGYAGAMLAERVGVGVAAGLAPGALLKSFGIDESEDSPTLRYFARLFAVRNAVLGVLVWEARHDPRRLERVAWINAVTELVDAAAAAAPLTTGRTKPQAAAGAIGASLAVSAAFAGLALRARRAR
ncbi:MAG: hypothetical protein RL134_2752 [Actinomycetota bacterium]|jgi:hypothetical protein